MADSNGDETQTAAAMDDVNNNEEVAGEEEPTEDVAEEDQSGDNLEENPTDEVDEPPPAASEEGLLGERTSGDAAEEDGGGAVDDAGDDEGLPEESKSGDADDGPPEHQTDDGPPEHQSRGGLDLPTEGEDGPPEHKSRGGLELPDEEEEPEHKSRGLFGKIGDFVEDKVDDIKDMEFKKPILIDIKGIRNAGQAVHESARDTTDLCNETVQKAKEMIDFGTSIKATLTNLGDNMDASALATIKDLVDGDQMKSAMSLAGEMDDLALRCVDKSTLMITSMNEAVDALPDAVEDQIENKVEKAGKKGSREGDPELPDIQPDLDELERCVTAVKEVNLVTVFDAGVNAFNGLTAKGEVCKDMFSAIKDFAMDIVEVSKAIQEFQISKMIGKMRDLARDIWRCLRLGDLIKAFAMQVGKLVKWIIDLFKIANEKLSMIWGALAHAKDVMADVIQHVLEAMGFCDEAKQKSDKLIETSREIKGHMGNMDNFDASTISSLKDLMDGDEIKLMIDLAMSMDDIVLNAVKKIVTMIQKVTGAFTNLPAVITEGISDMTEAGKVDDDPEPVDVEEDVRALDTQRSEIESANALTTIQASRSGFNGAEEKIAKTRDMLEQSRGFAESCNGNIEEFMGSWDLQKAMQKLIEMCRLVKLGEMLTQFCEQIRRLVKAVLDMLTAVRDKVMNFDLIPDELEDAVEDAVAAASKYCGQSCVLL